MLTAQFCFAQQDSLVVKIDSTLLGSRYYPGTMIIKGNVTGFAGINWGSTKSRIKSIMRSKRASFKKDEDDTLYYEYGAFANLYFVNDWFLKTCGSMGFCRGVAIFEIGADSTGIWNKFNQIALDLIDKYGYASVVINPINVDYRVRAVQYNEDKIVPLSHVQWIFKTRSGIVYTISLQARILEASEYIEDDKDEYIIGLYYENVTTLNRYYEQLRQAGRSDY